MPHLLILYVVTASFWLGLSLWLLRRQARQVMRHRDRVPPAFRDTITAAEHRRAAAYTVDRTRIAAVGEVAEWALTLSLVLWGADAMAGVIGRRLGPGLAGDLVLLALLAAILSVPGMVLSAWRSFVVEQRYGFNRTTPRLFAADLARRGLLAAVFGLPLLAALLGVMTYSQTDWWLYAWFGVVGLMLVVPVLYTRVVAPMFNRFERLEDPALVARIEALLAQCGFRSSGLWTMDASKRSSHGNAFFIGWGRSKRIVLFDTLLADRRPEEVEAVVAHELGHFRHRHVVFGMVRAAATAFVVLAAIGWLARQPALLSGFGFRHGGDAMSLFAANLLVGLALPLMAPFANGLSRRHEFQADDYARREVGAAPMISALVGLTRDSAQTLTPDPLYSMVHHSHPPVPLRVARLLETQTARR